MNRREFVVAMAAMSVAAKKYSSASTYAPANSGPTTDPPSFPAVDSVPLGNIAEGAFVLHDGWQMREEAVAGENGTAFSKAGFSGANDWYATTVPTTTLGTLIRHGIYPDPYVGLNNLLIPDASPEHNHRYNLAQYSHLPAKANPWSKPYWFRTEFHLPGDFAGKVLWLNLDGINYRADIWVNEHQVADHTKVAGMFQRFRFDVSQLLRRDGINAIAIRIHPLDFPGDPLHEQLGGLKGIFGPNGGDGEILRNVTQYCTIGWDWVPAARDRNVGIWQHVWLEGTGDIAVKDCAGFVRLSPARDAASLTVRFHCQHTMAKPIHAEVLIRVAPDGFTDQSLELRTTIDVPPGTPTEFRFTAADHPELVMKDPHLWWPVGYGEQPLYTLTVEVRTEGTLASIAQSKLGVRTVGTLILPSGGRAFTVNDRVIRMTGGAWVPDYLLSWSAQRYRDEVRLMAEGNHTIVRVNGCGIMPPDVFFDECDKRGLLVWQDFSRTSISPGASRKDHLNSGDPLPCDAALLLSNMKDCILRMRSHPSLLLYCGCNEEMPQRDFAEPMQNLILPEMDGTRPWLASSSSNPPWEKEELRTWSHGPYFLVRLPEYFRLYGTDKEFTSKNEIGLASPLPINSIANAIPAFNDPDLNAANLDKQQGYHDKTGEYFRATDNMIQSDIGPASCLAEYLYMADLYTSAGYRAIYEAANKARPRNAGTHLWKVNAAWPSMMWQVFDWYLQTNAGYYSMRSACKPLHVQHSVDDSGVQIVSTMNSEHHGMRVSLQLVSIDGKVEAAEDWVVNSLADSTTPVGTLPKLVNDGRLYFVGLTLFKKDGLEVDRSVTWMQKDCKWHDLLQIKPTTLSLSLKGKSIKAEETTYQLLVSNKTSIPAVNTRLSLLSGERGEEVLPSFWSDNAITILPGETRQLSVTFRSKLLSGKEPHVMAEGWNVLPSEVRLTDEKSIDLVLPVMEINPDYKTGSASIVAKTSQSSPPTKRITTWPLLVYLNGKAVRTVRLGVVSQAQSVAVVQFEKLTPQDRITVDIGTSAQRV